MIVADTSFLISLYGNDTNTSTAKAHVCVIGQPIRLHSFSVFEFENALRHRAFRGQLTLPDLNLRIQGLHDALQRGELLPSAEDVEAVINEALQLSLTHTLSGGHRSFDIIHVAAAKVLGAADFLSFDANQRQLANAEGLNVGP